MMQLLMNINELPKLLTLCARLEPLTYKIPRSITDGILYYDAIEVTSPLRAKAGLQLGNIKHVM